MAKLVIVESPAKAKTIGKYLGDDYEVTASMGHIRDLPASQLGIDVEHGYAPQYISIKGKEKLIKELKSKAKHADGVKRLSSDCSLQLDYMKLESLVIANQNVAVNTFPGLVHTARHTMGVGNARSQ